VLAAISPDKMSSSEARKRWERHSCVDAELFEILIG
jgi:hypothetical protein